MAHALAPGARYRSHRQAARRAGQWHGIFGHTREQAAHDRASAAGAATEKSSQTGSTFKRGRLPAQRRGGGGGGRTPAPSSSSSNRRARPLRAGVVCVCVRAAFGGAPAAAPAALGAVPPHTHTAAATAAAARALAWLELLAGPRSALPCLFPPAQAPSRTQSCGNGNGQQHNPARASSGRRVAGGGQQDQGVLLSSTHPDPTAGGIGGFSSTGHDPTAGGFSGSYRAATWRSTAAGGGACRRRVDAKRPPPNGL